MNAFDFLITVTLGSSFATVALNRNFSPANGILLIFLPVVLQYTITWFTVRMKGFKNLVTASPALLVYKGRRIKEAMKEERITIEVMHSTARKHGYSRIEDMDAVILETTGMPTVLEKFPDLEVETLTDMKKPYLEK